MIYIILIYLIGYILSLHLLYHGNGTSCYDLKDNSMAFCLFASFFSWGTIFVILIISLDAGVTYDIFIAPIGKMLPKRLQNSFNKMEKVVKDFKKGPQ